MYMYVLFYNKSVELRLVWPTADFVGVNYSGDHESSCRTRHALRVCGRVNSASFH